MAGRDFGPPVQDGPNKPNNRVKAAFINDLRAASIEDDARIDEKADAADVSAALAGKASSAALIAHEADTGNPHDVTAAQTGAYTTGQTDAAIATATGAVAGDLAAHEADTANPHGVTKDDVGLENVDNTSDANKPVSTAQQAALDTKLGKPAQDGVYGQVLTITHDGQRWVDVPGSLVPDLVLSPEGSLRAEGSVSPTLTAPVRTVPGSGGTDQAWVVEEGTTNLHPNPALVSSMTGWGVFAAEGNLTAKRVDTQPDMDAWVFEAEVTAKNSPTTGSFYFRMVGIPTPGLTGFITPSCLIKFSAPVVGRRVTRLSYADGGYVDTTSPLEAFNPDKQRMTFPAATVDPDRTLASSEGQIFVSGAAVNVGFRAWMGQGQVENKPYATSFAYGSMGAGYSWAGAAHASASTRATGSISVPYAGPIGSILVRYRDAGVTRTAHLSAPGTFGQYGTITHDGSALTIGSTRATEVIGIAVFADPLLQRDINAMLRYSGPYAIPMLPAYWTDPPQVVIPTTIMGLFLPNKTIATGGAALRIAPGTTATAIHTIPSGTAVHSTGTTLSASSVSYTLVWTPWGSGWVPTASLV